MWGRENLPNLGPPCGQRTQNRDTRGTRKKDQDSGRSATSATATRPQGKARSWRGWWRRGFRETESPQSGSGGKDAAGGQEGRGSGTMHGGTWRETHAHRAGLPRHRTPRRSRPSIPGPGPRGLADDPKRDGDEHRTRGPERRRRARAAPETWARVAVSQANPPGLAGGERGHEEPKRQGRRPDGRAAPTGQGVRFPRWERELCRGITNPGTATRGAADGATSQSQFQKAHARQEQGKERAAGQEGPRSAGRTRRAEPPGGVGTRAGQPGSKAPSRRTGRIAHENPTEGVPRAVPRGGRHTHGPDPRTPEKPAPCLVLDATRVETAIGLRATPLGRERRQSSRRGDNRRLRPHPAQHRPPRVRQSRNEHPLPAWKPEVSAGA